MWRVDFPTGATEASFIIPIVRDTIVEAAEEFSLKIVIESPLDQRVTVGDPSMQTVLITGTYVYVLYTRNVFRRLLVSEFKSSCVDVSSKRLQRIVAQLSGGTAELRVYIQRQEDGVG